MPAARLCWAEHGAGTRRARKSAVLARASSRCRCGRCEGFNEARFDRKPSGESGHHRDWRRDEHDLADTARAILAKAEEKGCAILLPTDCHVAKEFKANADYVVTTESDVPEDGMILDAGLNTVASIQAAFDGAKTVIWNGPLGAFELEPFEAGIRSRRSIMQAWRMSLPTSPQRVAHFWSGWKAKHCREWRRCHAERG